MQARGVIACSLPVEVLEVPKDEAERIGVSLERILLRPDEPPKPIHRFFYAVVGNEISLEVGYYDIRTLHLAMKARKSGSDEPVESKFYVTDRFVLSPSAAVDMYRNARNLLKFLKEQDLLPEGTEQELADLEAGEDVPEN